MGLALDKARMRTYNSCVLKNDELGYSMIEIERRNKERAKEEAEARKKFIAMLLRKKEQSA